MKNLLSLLFLLVTTLSSAQTVVGYRAATQPDGTQRVYKIFADGSRVEVNKLPSDAVKGRFGGTVRVPYAPEAPATFTPTQFGADKYFDPGFYMCVDLAGQYSIAQQRSYGANLFSPWALPENKRSDVNRGEAFGYYTEDQVFGPIKGRGVYEISLQDYYKAIYDRIPQCGQGGDTFFKLATIAAYNIEYSAFWSKDGYYAQDWDQKKGLSIKCEIDGQTRTLEQLQNSGLFEQEYQKRFANRMVLLMKMTKERSASDVKLMWGSSMHQYHPKVEQRGVQSSFLNFSCDVSKIGGDSQGNITLQTPSGENKTYKLTGSVWDAEDIMHGYYYWFNFDISQQDYQDIWVDHKSGTQTYPYLWSRIQPLHVVADEKGFIQQNREQMRMNQGGKVRPQIRLSAASYEGNVAGLVNGVPTAARAPFPNLQGVITAVDDPNYRETPKIWQAPYMFYSRYMVTRFFAGSEAGWGFHIFPPTTSSVHGDLSQMPIYQHHMHSYTAAFQARADMQPLERWYAGSTLVEDPDVLISGSWQNYDGTQAFNIEGGARKPQKPAFLLRYKATPNGWTVWILGGAPQGYTDESTWTVRVPNGGLNGNMFEVKLRGPGAQLYEFSVNSSDSGATYTGTVSVNPQFERPAYSGRTAAN